MTFWIIQLVAIYIAIFMFGRYSVRPKKNQIRISNDRRHYLKHGGKVPSIYLDEMPDKPRPYSFFYQGEISKIKDFFLDKH